MPPPSPETPTLFSVGHSNRTLPDFLRVLAAHGIVHVVDVRRWPRSRRHPHFDRDMLDEALNAAGIRYTHEEALGGHRSPRQDSPNDGWHEPAFRGYADHAGTAECQAAIDRVLAAQRLAGNGAFVSVMCAERDPETCHRRVLSDALVARGARVIHAIDETTSREHVPSPFARFDDGRVAWPAPPPLQPGLDFGP